MSVTVEVTIGQILVGSDGRRWSDNWLTGDLRFDVESGIYQARCRLTLRIGDHTVIQFCGPRDEVRDLFDEAVRQLTPEREKT